MPKDKDLAPMKRTDLEDEVMLLRAQVKVLQNWVALHKASPRPWSFEDVPRTAALDGIQVFHTEHSES
jgi:hypothetical protein